MSHIKELLTQIFNSYIWFQKSIFKFVMHIYVYKWSTNFFFLGEVHMHNILCFYEIDSN